MSSLKGATATVDLSALQHNINKLRALSPESNILAVVKANAYGHGQQEIAKALTSADAFGVARLDEALNLRTSGISAPVLLLEGFFSADDLPVLAEHELQTVVHTYEQLKALETAKLNAPINVWLKIDSGMHRLGVRPEQVDEFVTRLNVCPNVVKPIRFVSHFACADDLDSPVTTEQISCFLTLTEKYDSERSLAASAGILSWPDSRMEWNRPGIIMYGVSPFDDRYAPELGFKPVMTLKTCLIAVRDVKRGECVGYGGAWTSERDTKIGVIAMGYGDGYPRTAPNGTPVWVNGRLVPISGRVSMDMITIDLGPDAKDNVGDEVVLWGKELPVEEIAKHVGTIGYELITRLTSRVELTYISE